MKIIGLTGGSGCGKSTVSLFLNKKGGFIIDADKIAHDIIEIGNEAYNEIIEYFGKDILLDNGEINRKKLGNIVFNNSEKLENLNSITHKYIIKRINDDISRITENPGEYKYIVIDAPLLIQTGLYMICDSVWLINSNIDKRVERIVLRDNISKDDALARFKYQMDFDEFKQYADIIIQNDFNSIDEFYNYLEKSIDKFNI